MHRETSEWNVRMLVDLEGRMNVTAEYQRGKVWSTAQQALLIDSLLRDFSLPTIFLRKLPDGSKYLFDVVDGKQRLTAIWRFLSDDITLLASAKPFPTLGDLSGRRWSELNPAAQDKLQFASVTISRISDATDMEIRELFLRLQEGEPLYAAEVRNAMAGPLRDYVADTLARHDLWPLTRIRSARRGLDEHSAILLALAMKGGPTGLKGSDLQELYADKSFDPESPSSERALWLLNQLHAIANEKPGLLRTRWGLVDLAVVLMRLQEGGSKPTPDKMASFFEAFEEERRDTASTLADLQTQLVEWSRADAPPKEILQQPDIPSEMLSYHLAFSREGANESNIKTRSEIMHKRLASYLSERL